MAEGELEVDPDTSRETRIDGHKPCRMTVRPRTLVRLPESCDSCHGGKGMGEGF